MSLLMDIYGHIEGIPADAVAHPRTADLKTPSQYGDTSLGDWFDEAVSKVVCLIKAPNKDASFAGQRDA